MRLRQIEIFYHVYRQGSISGAARELHVSQPSVSKVLRHAEDQLGFQLFRRLKGRLTPTPAADELFGDVREIYESIGALNRSASNIRGRSGGHVRLGVLPSLSLSVVPTAIARLREANPDLSFEVTTLYSDELNTAVLEKKCDLCIGFGTKDDERLVTTPFADVELALIARKGKLSSASDRVSLDVLHRADFIGLRDSGPAGTVLAERLHDEKVVPNEVVIAHTYYVAASLVRLGVGLSVVDQFTAQSFMAEGLDQFLFAPAMQHPVCAVSLKDGLQPELIEQCLEIVGDLLHG